MFLVLKRLGLLLLFLGAVYSTWYNISNVSVKDLNEWFRNKDRDKSMQASFYTSSQQAASAQSLEHSELTNFLDLAQYPSRNVVATGYTAGYESTGKNKDHPAYGITYSGVEVTRDLYSTIAADTDIFPIGTILFIPGYGYGVVADTGSAIKGDKVDLYYPTVDAVYQNWGKQNVEVYVIEEGDGTLKEEELIHYNNNETMQVFREAILNE
ncbi:3D domain-containing protein [Halobacillus sp. Marseille-P3879]|uniref:3D domain-containing protein n=1 Tax=Halobacillus TaxID=45667 RepID=UPI000C795B99|nr:3D domain-containing protein [Halobacillus sp. Marseille-P3879]